MPPASTQPAVSGANAPTETIYPINIASPLKRLYAFAIDIGLLYIIILVTKRIFGGAVWAPEAAPQDIGILLGYFVLPTAYFGRTIGKWVAGIRVVDETGRHIGIAAIPREVLGRFIATILLGAGLAYMVLDPKRQGLHDKIAGSLVINTPDSGGTGFMRRWFRIDKPVTK